MNQLITKVFVEQPLASPWSAKHCQYPNLQFSTVQYKQICKLKVTFGIKGRTFPDSLEIDGLRRRITTWRHSHPKVKHICNRGKQIYFLEILIGSSFYIIFVYHYYTTKPI